MGQQRRTHWEALFRLRHRTRTFQKKRQCYIDKLCNYAIAVIGTITCKYNHL